LAASSGVIHAQIIDWPDRIQQQISGRQRPCAKVAEAHTIPLLFKKDRVIQNQPELQRPPEQMPNELITANLRVAPHAVGKPKIKIGAFRQTKLFLPAAHWQNAGKPF